MIFAEIKYETHYWNLHTELLTFLSDKFSKIEAGLQSDSWIWILDGEEKVALDTFTSMKHQVKSPRAGSHVDRVIEILQSKYALEIYTEPEHEAHEGEDG